MRKAFNTVAHNILVYKWHHYGKNKWNGVINGKFNQFLKLKLFDNEHKAFRNLERSQFLKHHVVMIESNLSWNDHVLNLAFKISKTIRIMARLRHSYQILSYVLNIYNSLIIHITLNLLLSQIWACNSIISAIKYSFYWYALL